MCRINRKSRGARAAAGALLFAGLGLLAACGTDKEQEAKRVFPGIICWGDSLTFGDGGEGCSYPLVLQETLREELFDIPVVNMGACGEDSITIAGRSGAIPFVLAEDAEFLAGEESTELTLCSVNGEKVFPSLYNDVGINPCRIGDVEGTLAIKEIGNMDSRYLFTRTKTGEAETLKAGTVMETAAAEQYKNYFPIVFLGTNGGFQNYEELVAQQNAILESRTENTGEYLVIGMLRGDRSANAEYDRIMEEAYGAYYMNLREYLAEQGMEAAGLQETEEDVRCREEGRVPVSLMADDVHLNAAGYRVAGKAVYQKLEALGCLDELKALK